MVASTESMGSGRRSPPLAPTLLAYLLVAGAVVALGHRFDWASNLGRVADWPLKAAAIWLACRVARSERQVTRVRHGWALVAIAFAVLLLGESGSAAVAALAPEASARHAFTALHFLVHPLMLAALLRMQRLFESRTAVLTFTVDALIVVLGAAMVLWAFFLQSAFDAGLAEAGAGRKLMAFAYPAGDLLLLFGVATVLLRRPAGATREVFLWLAGALVLALTGDVLWARMLATGVEPAARTIAQLTLLGTPWCVAMAALRQREAPDAPTPGDPFASRESRLLPYVAALVGAGLLVRRGLTGEPSEPVLMTLAACLFVAVLARQAISQRQAVGLVRERAERESAVRRDALLEHSADAILVIDDEQRIRYANPGFARMVGRRCARGDPFLPCVAESDRPRLQTTLRRTRGAGAHRTRLRLASGDEAVIVEAALSEFPDAEAAGALVLNLRDVTEQAALEEQLARRMLNDPLTGLPNRALLLDRLEQALSRAARSRRSVAVLLADLDRFKMINDTCSHAVGDAVLVAAAERLVEAAPASATVARAADDEFAVIMDGELSIDDLTRAAETVRSAFDAPFEVKDRPGHPLVVTASIGIAGPTRNESAPELLRKADVAMNQAKNAGRNQVIAFEPRIDRALGTRAALLSGLRRAVSQRRIDVAFQPIYDLTANRLSGLEALARWVDPEHGHVAPGVFIAVAEDGGLMHELGALVFERALEHARGIEREFQLAVNISTQQLADHAFSGLILNGLRAAGWPPERLLLEMTESVIAEDRRVVRRNLNYLREAGVRIAIDDFGTGYSSLSQLHDFPVDVLKIDRRFIDQIGTAAGHETVRAVIAIGRALGLDIIAEGVENENQLETLRELECRFIQGYLFGQPLFAGDLKRLSTRAG